MLTLAKVALTINKVHLSILQKMFKIPILKPYFFAIHTSQIRSVTRAQFTIEVTSLASLHALM